MQGLYYLLSFVGLGVIIKWFIDNERLKPGEPTRGLLRMERDAPQASSSDPPRGERAPRQRWQRGM